MDKYFLDTEFIDTGTSIDLISIGVVCSDGRELYLQSTEFDLQNANSWVKEHVLPHLSLCPHVRSHGDTLLETLDANKFEHPRGQCIFEHPARGITGLRGVKAQVAWLAGAHADCYWRDREHLKIEVQQFFNPSDGFELWGWCAGYDFVSLCQLFGAMMNLPVGWPHYIRDLQYLLDEQGISDDVLVLALSQQGTKHNALDDARYIRRAWEFLSKYKGSSEIKGSVSKY